MEVPPLDTGEDTAAASTWQALSELPERNSIRKELKEAWRDSDLRTAGMTLGDFYYLNWEGWSCSGWVDGFRGLVTHAAGRWNPRRLTSGSDGEHPDGFSDYTAMIIDRGGHLIGEVSPRYLRSDHSGSSDPDEALEGIVLSVLAQDNGWPTRDAAQQGVAAVLTDSALGRATHARSDVDINGCPIMRYLVGESNSDEPSVLGSPLTRTGVAAVRSSGHQSGRTQALFSPANE